MTSERSTPVDGEQPQTDQTDQHLPSQHTNPHLEEAGPMSSSSSPTVEYNGAQAPSTDRDSTRLRTVVWGLVLILLGGVVIAIGLGARLDPTSVFIGILAIAGATLLVGALVSAARGRPKE